MPGQVAGHGTVRRLATPDWTAMTLIEWATTACRGQPGWWTLALAGPI
jgi:hypothetical protein